jgi:hypothetical protein
MLETSMPMSRKGERTFSVPCEAIAGLGIYALYLLVRRAVVTPEGEQRALANARRVVGLEDRLGLHVEPRVQQAMLPYPRLLHALSVAYAVGNVGLTVGWLIRLFRRRHPQFHGLRTAVALTTLAALPVFRLFPCAPPRKLDHMVDTINEISGFDLDSGVIAKLYDPLAAMPSIHMTYAVITGHGIAQTSPSRLVRTLGKLYPSAVALTIVATANHYVLDAVAGSALGALGLRATRCLRGRSV